MANHIQIFDTTLRDGEQSPGASMDATEKLAIARELLRLGVDIIECGFPASSPGDFASVQRLAAFIGEKAVVCALSRAVASDIEAAAAALGTAARPRIHTGLGVSPSHLKYKLGISQLDALNTAVASVKTARNLCADVQFYAEDAGRADRDFLAKVLEAVIAAGATTVNIPDTTGGLLPQQYGDLITWIFTNVTGIDGVTVAVHCHNDLGLATANSLAGIAAGATQVECTINGIGERAGNAALEEVAVALALHSQQRDASGSFNACGLAPSLKSATTNINLQELTRASRLVSSITGISVPPNKAIVGANAFAHSSGIHQDGVLKQRQTYEIIEPAMVGAAQSSIILSARSGRAALRHQLEQLGYTPDQTTFELLNTRFLQIADKKSQVYDEDLEALMAEYDRNMEALWSLKILQVSCGSPAPATATIVLASPDGSEHTACASGTGPIDATFKAIDAIVGQQALRVGVDPGCCSSQQALESAPKTGDPGSLSDLRKYAVQAITRGSDALGEVSVQLADAQGRLFSGRGADGDIIVSSAKAYLNALNRLLKATDVEK